ncbi:Ran-binding protein [Neofusicoccum parvum]|nr:Ran-binding protein [Neofusicoccum parvum]
MDIDGQGGLSGSYRGGQQYASASYGSGVDASAPPFFVPSYLKGSRHAERLEEAHKARLSAQRDARSSGTGSLSRSSSSANLHKMVPSHRGMTHDIIERAPPAAYMDEKERLWPTHWNEEDKSPGLELLRDGLDVKCGSMSKTHDEALSVRTDHPMPRQCGIYYFEVTVVGKGKEGLIGIGFSGPKVALHRLPGWEPDSWGYHGDDGFSFCSTSAGKSYGPKFSMNDVIGCGVNFRTNTAFFTKNGVHLGVAFRNIPDNMDLYPALGVKKNGEHLRANFGQEPFVFDIDSEYKATEVREESHALATGGTSNAKDLEPEEDIDAVNRQKIRAAILDGDIDKALKLTTAFYPTVLRDNESIYFKLRCRKFIEMIRRCQELQNPASKIGSRNNAGSNGFSNNSAVYDDVFDGQMELDESNGANNSAGNGESMDTTGSDTLKLNELLGETLQYGQELKGEFSTDPRREVKHALEDTFALMAYSDPRQSPLAYMLDPNERTPVAEELNSAILVSLGKSSSAALERLVQQTEALIEKLAEDGGAGAFVNVRGDYLGAHEREKERYL